MLPSTQALLECHKLFTPKFFEALQLVEYGTLVIDWEKWYHSFLILESLGLIKEKEETQFNLFVHRYNLTDIGKGYLTWYKSQQKKWPIKLRKI